MSASRWAMLALTSLSSLPLVAQDDRENSSPTGAIWYPSISVSTLTNLTNAGWRITNLKVASTTGPTFAAALVSNTGAYAKGWAWYYGQTETSVRSLLATNNARPIDIEPYLDGGNLRYAVVMVANSGTDNRPWWWVTNTTPTGITNAVNANSARVYEMDTYTVGASTLYSSILYSNTGSHTRGWWYYFGLTSASLNSALSTNSARLIDVQRTGLDSYNAVMYQLSDKRWHGTGNSSTVVTDSLINLGARLVCLDPYAGTFAVGMTNNLNAESRRVNDIMRGISGGNVGAYLKRANGGVTTGFGEGRQFEPASTLKTLQHTLAMRRVAVSTLSLTQNVSVPLGMTGSCPTGSGSVSNETLESALRAMMESSDNARTRAITTVLGGGSASNGLTVLTSFAAGQGMTDTEMNHHIGCGSPANNTTLVDMGRLHESVINGYLLTAANRQKYYDLMTNLSGYAIGRVVPIIDAEATSVGLTATQKAAFSSEFFLAGKRGGYGTGTGFHHTWFGYFKVPYYSETSGVSYREFVGGAYCGSAPVDADADSAAATGAAELLRTELRSAMQSWRDYVGGVIGHFGVACAGSAGVPLHTASGQARIGAPLTYSLSNARASSPTVLYFGASRTSWNSVPLPLNLAFAGANGCFVNVALTLPVNMVTNGSGANQVTLNAPVDPGMIGATVYAQHLVVDPGANGLGIVTTRGSSVQFGSALP